MDTVDDVKRHTPTDNCPVKSIKALICAEFTYTWVLTTGQYYQDDNNNKPLMPKTWICAVTARSHVD